MQHALAPLVNHSPVAADLFRPQARGRAAAYNLLLVLAGAALLAMSSWVEVRLPMSVVPVTGQTFAVLLLGALLGPQLGVAAVMAYLAQGAAGLPVFAGGAAGAAWLVGPTGGYLFGFLPAAWITGRLAKAGWDRSMWRTAAAMALGNAAIYGVGLPWLALFLGAELAAAQGLLPFLVGDALKLALAACVLPMAWRVLGRFR